MKRRARAGTARSLRKELGSRQGLGSRLGDSASLAEYAKRTAVLQSDDLEDPQNVRVRGDDSLPPGRPQPAQEHGDARTIHVLAVRQVEDDPVASGFQSSLDCRRQQGAIQVVDFAPDLDQRYP